jgi:cytochrome oxidase Cu insertion factor (SCO1/SenC/PrrC family)/thiol-disulfide isomerase/thioredoxin
MSAPEQLTTDPSANQPDSAAQADSGGPGQPGRWPRWRLLALSALAVAVVAGAVAATLSSRSATSSGALATNPALDPGTPLNRPAPDFTLIDERGHRVSLRSLRGKVVMLAFNDSECTTICPLTTTAMVDARRALGRASSSVALLGVDANPDATSVHDVLSYSQLHGLLGQWRFLTGSLPQLHAVWKAYNIAVEIQRGQIDHTPALFLIDPQGRLRRVYLTQASYAAVGQFGQLLAQEASRLLPGHPPVAAHQSYAQIKGVSPSRPYSLPAVGGGTLKLGPGSPHLYLFFDTWDRQVTNLGSQLGRLRRYVSDERGGAGLPALQAVDEGTVEPGPSALPTFLSRLGQRPSYPVAIDQTGRVADGYGVQDEPWLVLTSSSGRVAWYHDISTSGWLGTRQLERTVKAALARAPKGPASAAAAQRQLAGSPAPLASLHSQASQLLGSTQELMSRIRSLRGYPLVVNVWASWCGPCRAEFGLLASASASYGRQVAFLGADYNDPSTGDAESFLRQHLVSYPSYHVPQGGIQALLPGGLLGTPTTVFISPAGKVVYVHTGQYLSQGTLDQDIQAHALTG